MAFPVASGVPSLSGSYLPIVYASMLLVEFYKSTVFGGIASTEFEGQIKNQGETLRIRTLPDLAVNSYVKGQKLVYQNGNPSYVDLNIDKGLSWSFRVNDVDQKQSDLTYVQKWAEHASMNLKIELDRTILADVYADVSADNKGTTAGKESNNINLGVSGTPFQLTSSTVIDKIIDCGTVLDEQDVPEEGRWIVLPSWACALIKKSDLQDASLSGDRVSIARNGRVGMIDRFEIYRSNNVSKVADGGGSTAWNAMFGWKGSLAFASQMLKSESLRDHDDFGDLMRGLQIYGYQVVKPEGMGHLYIKQ
jgi:hypothetical protein